MAAIDLLIVGVLVVIGLLLAAVGVGLLWRMWRFRRSATRVLGTVVEVESIWLAGNQGGGTTWYKPIYEFDTPDGRRLRVAAKSPEASNLRTVGSQCEILVNIDNPDVAHEAKASPALVGVICILIGLAMASLGLLFVEDTGTGSEGFLFMIPLFLCFLAIPLLFAYFGLTLVLGAWRLRRHGVWVMGTVVEVRTIESLGENGLHRFSYQPIFEFRDPDGTVLRGAAGSYGNTNTDPVGSQRDILVDFSNPDLVQVSPYARLLTGVAFLVVGLGIAGGAVYLMLVN